MTLPPINLETQTKKNGRIDSPRHRTWVKKHLCIAYHFGDCRGRIACCHARDIAPRGHGGNKPSDEWTFSACDKHHAESEKREQAWGDENGIDVRSICLEFAAKSPDKAIRDAAKAYKS